MKRTDGKGFEPATEIDLTIDREEACVEYNKFMDALLLQSRVPN